MKLFKKVAATALATSMAFGLVACSSQEAAPAGDSTTTETTDAAATTETGDATATEATGSGNLVIYTGAGPEITDPILAGFKAQYPDINVEIVKAGSGELLARIKAEAGNPGGDILLGGDPYLYEVNADIFQPYVSPTDADMIVSNPEGLWHPWSMMLTPIAVNKDRLPNEADWPKNLADLTDEKYKADGIAYCDPSKSGTGANIANNIASLLGWDAFAAMLDNFVVLEGSDPMFDAVKDGTYPIAFVNEDLGQKWLEVGLPIELIYPEDGVINTIDCLSIIKDSKNIDNAQLFVDYFGSPENHEILVNEVLRRSTRSDAPLAEGLKPATDYNLIQAELISRDDITAKFNEAYEASRKN